MTELNTRLALFPPAPTRPALTSPVTPDIPRLVHREYQKLGLKLLASDLAIVLVAAVIAAPLRFGVNDDTRTNGPFNLTYWTFGLLIAGGWFAALQIYRSRDARVLGEGVDEYRRIMRATLMFFGTVAIFSLVFKFDSSRGYLAIALPLGTVGLLLERRLWRAWLHRRREAGAMIARAIVIGGTDSARTIAAKLHGEPRSGIQISGVWVPDRTTAVGEHLDRSDITLPAPNTPVFGDQHALRDVVQATRAEVAIISSTDHLGHAGLKRLVWELEALGIAMLLSPSVVDVADSRIEVSTVARLPFLALQPPTYADASAWPKQAFDRLGAVALIIMLSPLLAATAALVAMTSRGSVLYRQERIGRNGEPFAMVKFRSMQPGSDADLGRVLAEQGTELGVMAKLQDDPRVTGVGRFIRRFSIDELPQLFNVLGGSMSLVGPRPQRQFEVDLYDRIAHRRLRVLPGMTGLWQVSGRSDLSWDDAIKLDTYYVENWSMTGDLQILWRTVKAVVQPQGAY